MRIRIICIGNRFHQRDSGGPRVYDILSTLQLPAGVELFDGGLSGLNLLGLLEDVDYVIFVDSVEDFLPDTGVVVVKNPVDELEYQEFHDYTSGLAYLLRSAPYALDSPMPRVYLVGLEGAVESGLSQEAAGRCLQLIEELRSLPAIAS